MSKKQSTKSMHWKKPPIIKIYEALGALADGRIEKAKDSCESSGSTTGYPVVEPLKDGQSNHRTVKTLSNGDIEEWQVYSSSGNKFYMVRYDKQNNAIMSNDNGSYWQGYLGYPAIAVLLITGAIKYQPKFAEALKGIKWKDLNTKFKNDYNKTIQYCHQLIRKRGYDLEEFLKEVKNIDKQIQTLKIKKLGKRLRPPQGY